MYRTVKKLTNVINKLIFIYIHYDMGNFKATSDKATIRKKKSSKE